MTVAFLNQPLAASARKGKGQRSSLVHPAGKTLEGAFIGAFDVIGKGAGGQFVHLQVIPDAFTALALARAGFIRAVALRFIEFYVAVHGNPNLIMRIEDQKHKSKMKDIHAHSITRNADYGTSRLNM